MGWGLIALISLITMGLTMLMMVAAIPGSGNASTGLKIVGTVLALIVAMSAMSFALSTMLFVFTLF